MAHRSSRKRIDPGASLGESNAVKLVTAVTRRCLARAEAFVRLQLVQVGRKIRRSPVRRFWGTTEVKDNPELGSPLKTYLLKDSQGKDVMDLSGQHSLSHRDRLVNRLRFSDLARKIGTVTFTCDQSSTQLSMDTMSLRFRRSFASIFVSSHLRTRAQMRADWTRLKVARARGSCVLGSSSTGSYSSWILVQIGL